MSCQIDKRKLTPLDATPSLLVEFNVCSSYRSSSRKCYSDYADTAHRRCRQKATLRIAQKTLPALLYGFALDN